MIRKDVELEALLTGGGTVSLVGRWNGPGFRLVRTDTNETVSKGALKRLVKRGTASVVATDICGDPMQWGCR